MADTDIDKTDKERKKRSAIDEKLLQNARKSPTEIAELTGLRPEDVAERISRLLEDRGYLSERQDERLMLVELGDLISESRERLKTAADVDFAPIGKIVLGAFQVMAERWDKRKRLVDADIEKISAANAKIFGEAYGIAGNDIISTIETVYSIKIPDDERYEILRGALQKADRSLNKNVLE
jgi:DNA-binding Lrp family transcriptional regulator